MIAPIPPSPFPFNENINNSEKACRLGIQKASERNQANKGCNLGRRPGWLSAQGCLSAKGRTNLLHLPQGTGLGGQAPAEVESGTESQKGPERGAPGPDGCPAPWTTCALEPTGPLSRLCPGAARPLPQPPPSQAPHPGQRLLLLGAQVPSSAAHDALSAGVQGRSARPAARPVFDGRVGC